MPSRWIPITLLTIAAVGLLAALISIAVGEENVQLIAVEDTGEVQELIGGIRQLDERLGDDDAAVSLTLFTDVQCPRCAEYQAEVIDPLIAEQVRTGEAKINFRNFPLGQKPVTLGAIAVAAAQQQDRGWQYAELFMRNLHQVPERGVSKEYLDAVAGATPKLDTALWERAVLGDEAAERAEADVELATELRLSADPAVIVEGARGSETLERAPSAADLLAAMDRVR
jgi:protein-disulfide isomerase